MRLTKQAIEENHTRFLERNALHKSFGFDAEASVAFILSKALPFDQPVLEIGSGNGRFLLALARQFQLVTTVDISPSEQDIARLNVAYEGLDRRVHFVIADAAALPWRDGRFKTVVSMNAMHHIEYPLRIVAEMERVACRDGKIVISDFDETGFSIIDRVHRAEGRVHPRSIYRFDDIEKFLRDRGWDVSITTGNNQEVLVAVPSKRA